MVRDCSARPNRRLLWGVLVEISRYWSLKAKVVSWKRAQPSVQGTASSASVRCLDVADVEMPVRAAVLAEEDSSTRCTAKRKASPFSEMLYFREPGALAEVQCGASVLFVGTWASRDWGYRLGRMLAGIRQRELSLSVMVRRRMSCLGRGK